MSQEQGAPTSSTATSPAPEPAYVGTGYVGPTYAAPTYAAPPGRVATAMARLAVRSPQWLAPAAILTCFAGAAAYVTVRDPTESGAGDITTCLLKLTTGFDCPGCGGTRAFFYLLNGQIPAAARHHLLFVFAVPFLLYMYVAWGGQKVFGWRIPQLRLSPAVITGFLVVAAVFTVLRNLPWPPFTWLYV